jgi:hypothetical protein
LKRFKNHENFETSFNNTNKFYVLLRNRPSFRRLSAKPFRSQCRTFSALFQFSTHTNRVDP